jgi:uncharacterized protein YggE
VGYTIRQTVSVKIRDFAKIGEILSGIVSEGANSVSNLNFVIDDPYELQNQAKAEAIQNAKKRAEALAKAGGFRVGRLLSIDESVSVPPIAYDNRAYKTEAMGNAAPSIEPGSQDVQVSVNLRYEIR